MLNIIQYELVLHKTTLMINCSSLIDNQFFWQDFRHKASSFKFVPHIVSGMWEHFWLHLDLFSTLWPTMGKAKAKICSTLAFKYFLKYWTFSRPIQSSLSFSSQKYQNFWNWTKINVFAIFFSWNFFEEESHLS